MDAMPPRIGFIGIGNMGWPMAANLVKAGHQVTVYDADSSRTTHFIQEHGAARAADLQHIAQQDFVITMLPTGQIVSEVLTGGEGVFLRNARAATVVIDMSSSEPAGTQALAKILATHQISLLDAPVSGAVPRAKLGTLTIMIGGDDKAAIDRAKPVLAAMGDRLFETGGSGTGHAVKALNNFIAATAYTATAEAILIARRFGLDPRILIDIVNVSTGKSFISDIVMKDHVLDEKFATGFALGLLAKDVNIAAELGESVRLDAPLSRLIRDRWALARERVGYSADHTEAIKGWADDIA